MPTSQAVMLPNNVRPSRYTLSLAPDLAAFNFTGEETVEIEVLEPTDSLVLNCTEIAVQSCRLTPRGGTAISPVETVFSEEDETVTFRFGSSLPVAAATLEISFTGELNDKLRGFYRSKYLDTDGVERYLATTQFESTDARRAFPCWDEPSLKATFKVTLEVPTGLVALSNMQSLTEVDLAGGLTRVEFAETPKMSTYLLAFIVGDLRFIEQHADGGTLVRVWATPGKESAGRFTLDVSLRLLGYFNEYFGVPYPLDKLDHVAVPDFAAGAMENWGVITYRETAILVDPQHSSAGTRQIVASIVAHEMAHMWFGDLVTMAWWDSLWLNESFASWMGDKAVDHLFPEWQTWTQFVSSETNRALSLDGLMNSHPIEQEVSNPDEIGQLFDAISYSKGGSVLRMLEHFLGADSFRRGLRDYIRKHQYANARTRDLWDALGDASGQPVAAMMDTWVMQTGYPVIQVRTARPPGQIQVEASQNRFVYERLVDREAAGDALWQVPLMAATSQGGEAPPLLMQGTEAVLSLPLPPGATGDAWVKVNPDQTGFYRVNYSDPDWERLGPAISRRELSASDRLGLQNDAYALSRAGYLSVTRFLTLARSYVDETDAYVWEDLAANLGALNSLLAGEPYYGRFQELARWVFRPVVGRVGWDANPGEGHLDALLRSAVLGALGRYDDGDVLAEASSRFALYAGDPAAVHPDIRGVVLTLAARRADRASYDRIWELQKAATLEEEKVRLLASLAHVQQPRLLQETLDRSLTSDVRVHETVRVIAGVSANRHGRDLAWEFVKSNWSELDRRYGEGGFAMMRLVGITSHFTTREKMEDVQRFFRENRAPSADRTVRQSLEVIRLNIAWLEQNRGKLEAWLPEA